MDQIVETKRSFFVSNKSSIFALLALVGAFSTCLYFAFYMRQNHGVDLYVLMSAGKAVLHRQDPYAMRGLNFYTPAWSLLLFAPLSLLSFKLVDVIWSCAALIVWLMVLRRFRIDTVASSIFLLSPPFIKGMILGSYDWLAMVGFLVPASLGGWFLFLKPQLTLGYLALYAKEEGIQKAIQKFGLPVAAMLAFVIVGYYRPVVLSEMYWNTSLGLVGVPVGLYFVWVSFKRRDAMYAVAASPFLMPYVGVQTWAVAYLLVARNKWLLLVAVIAGWALWFVR